MSTHDEAGVTFKALQVEKKTPHRDTYAVTMTVEVVASTSVEAGQWMLSLLENA